jgi:hypothetical protein
MGKLLDPSGAIFNTVVSLAGKLVLPVANFCVPIAADLLALSVLKLAYPLTVLAGN